MLICISTAQARTKCGSRFWGAAFFPVNFRIKKLFWNLQVHFDCAGSCKEFVCVCVEHLKRCKTSTWWFRFTAHFNFIWFCMICCWVFHSSYRLHYHLYSRGVIHDLDWWPNEEGQGSCWYHGWSPWRTCFIFMSIFCNGTWLTQEPPSRFQTICFLFSTSSLHGFRNLNYCRLCQMEQLPLAEAK